MKGSLPQFALLAAALAPLAAGSSIALSDERAVSSDTLILEEPSARILQLAARSTLDAGEENPGGGATAQPDQP